MQPNNAKAERSATRFFVALRDVFVGAPVQRMRAKGEGRNPGFLLYPFSFILFLLGQSGFINLMRIKSRYWTRSSSELLVPWCLGGEILFDIEVALKPFPGFKQELFDKLYDFFHRLKDVLGEIVRQSKVEFSYDEE
jgi:hypothetical protein